MALVADGGSSTTVDVISSSSGDTDVSSLDTSDSTSTATVVQEGCTLDAAEPKAPLTQESRPA